MAIAGDGFGPTISLDGARKVRGNLTSARIRWMVLALVLGFGLVGGRLVQLGMVVPDSTTRAIASALHLGSARMRSASSSGCSTRMQPELNARLGSSNRSFDGVSCR